MDLLHKLRNVRSSQSGALIALALAGAVLLGGVASAQSIRVLSDRVLAGDAATGLDIRWATDSSVYISSYFAGVLRVSTTSGVSTRAAFAQPGRTCPSCANLGLSSSYMVTSFPVYELAWKRLDQPQIHRSMFDAIIDLDVHGNHLLMLGSRTEGEKWAPDGAIAWMGSLDRNLKDLRPGLYSSQGARAMTVARCGFLEPGAVRFFSDGSFVVVPGVEPDVYLYDRTGKLVHTWQTAGLKVFDRCELPEPQVNALSADPEQRARWRAKRAMIDDVLATPAGPALLVHEIRGGSAHWTMIILRRNGPPQKIALPFTSRSGVSSVRADVRGNRIAFLIRTSGEWRPNTKPTPARLIVAELR